METGWVLRRPGGEHPHGLIASGKREKAMKNDERFVHVASRGVCWLSAVSLFFMMVLTCCDVILRYFGYPIRGTYDVVGLSSAFVLALPIAYTQLLRGHVGIDFIVQKFPVRLRRAIDVTNGVLNFVVYTLLAWQCSLYGIKLWSVGRVSESVKIPLFPFPLVVAFGCALMSVVLLFELYRFVRPVEEA